MSQPIDFNALFEAAKTKPNADARVARLTTRLTKIVEELFHHRNSPDQPTLLLQMAEYLEHTDHKGVALEAAKTAHNYPDNDSTELKALGTWERIFDKLPSDAKKIATLESMQETLQAGTSLEAAYNRKWEALPDSPTKRDAAKTPEFYKDVEDRFRAYLLEGMKKQEGELSEAERADLARRIKKQMSKIERLKFDTRSAVDFVGQALADDHNYQGISAILAQTKNTGDNSAEAREDHAMLRMMQLIFGDDEDLGFAAKPRVQQKRQEQQAQHVDPVAAELQKNWLERTRGKDRGPSNEGPAQR